MRGFTVCGIVFITLKSHLSLFSYFDAHGNYYAKDDPDSIQDNWLTDVDWSKVSCHKEVVCVSRGVVQRGSHGEVQVECVTGGMVQRGSHGGAGGMRDWGRGAEG